MFYQQLADLVAQLQRPGSAAIGELKTTSTPHGSAWARPATRSMTTPTQFFGRLHRHGRHVPDWFNESDWHS
jgi:hypothetical protein